MTNIVFDLSSVRASLADARASLGDLAPLHGSIAEYMVKATRERFRTSTAPDGTRWRPKTPATIAAYKARGDGNRPKPLIGPSGRLGKEIASYSSRDGAVIGSALVYSGVMQDGAAKGAFGVSASGRPLPWGNIPARVFIGISGENERQILGLVDDYIAKGFGGE